MPEKHDQKECGLIAEEKFLLEEELNEQVRLNQSLLVNHQNQQDLKLNRHQNQRVLNVNTINIHFLYYGHF